MARRKRLTPPQIDVLSPVPSQAPSEDAGGIPAGDADTALETKAFPLGVARTRTHRPPIAQVAGDSAAAAALDELTEALSSARAEGRLAIPLPLDAIDAHHLVRDRIGADSPGSPDDPEMDELVASLRARGQRTAIEVLDRGEGAVPRYGLISGWRRLTALRRIAAEDGEVGQVAAIVRAPEGAAEAYLSMVEENEIRLGLSLYERARIVVKALEAGVFDDARTALQTLFANVSRTKRSKIKSLMAVVEALDGTLRFPAALSERAGLDLARALEAPGAAERLQAALVAAAPASAAAEADALAGALRVGSERTGPKQTGQGGAAPDAGRPAAAPADLPPIRLHRTGDTLTLTGPGVDDSLARDLQAWLRRRTART